MPRAASYPPESPEGGYCAHAGVALPTALKPLSQVMTIETPTGVLAAEETVPLAGGGYGGHSAAASAMSHTAAATHARSSRHRRRRRAIANVFNGPRFSTVNIH